MSVLAFMISPGEQKYFGCLEELMGKQRKKIHTDGLSGGRYPQSSRYGRSSVRIFLGEVREVGVFSEEKSCFEA